MTKEVNHRWVCLDARGKALGRLASEASILLRGKDKIDYRPYLDCGSHVVIINVANVVFTGNKMINKRYYHHSGYLGNLKTQMMADLPLEKVLFRAVSGMLPTTKLKKNWLKRLHIYLDDQHPHKANLAGQLKNQSSDESN